MIRRRQILSEIESHIPNKQYTIITGARQVGKTSLLKLVFTNLERSGKTVYYLNLEDQRILDTINEHPEKVFNIL